MTEEERKSVAALISADPAFAALEASGTPIVAVSDAPLRVLHLNPAAVGVFGANAAIETIFASPSSLSRVTSLVETARRNGAPRLERASIVLPGGPQTVTILCRRMEAGAEGPCYVVAALGLRAASAVELPPALSQQPQLTLVETPAPAAEPAPPAEDQTERLRRELRERHGASPPRFLWKTDSDGRFVEATHVLAAVAGAKYAAVLGRSTEEIAREFGLGRAFLEAFASRVAWSGVTVDWPLEAPPARAPVTLGAMPIFDVARNFQGFRGFGVMRLDVATPRLQEPAPALQPSAAETNGFAGANVVALRPTLQQQRESAEGLSATERSAFDEIARTLTDAPAEAPAPQQGSARDLIDHVTRSLESARAPTPPEAASVPQAARMLDVLPVGVLVARGADLLYANRTLLDYLGYADLDALEQDGGLARMFMGRMPARAPNVKALEVMDSDGETLDVDAHLQTIDWEGGPATLISLRRRRPSAGPSRAEEASLREKDAEIARLGAESKLLDACFDASAAPSALIGGDGRILRANAAFSGLFGAKWNAAASRELAGFFGEEEARRIRTFLAPDARPTATGESVATLRGPDGAEHRLALTRLDTEHFLCTAARGALDASRRELEESRREAEVARLAAERASAAKSDFLARVSHEIRTPLGAILGFAEVMIEERFGPIGSERYKEYLRDVHSSGAHVLSLVNDLLDLSKIEAGKLELSVQPIDVNAIIGECVSIMQPQANRERVIIRLSLSPRLPRIHADERSLRQILLNLLSNAIKFNEPGGQVIVTSTLTETGEVLLRVKDTGIGMSPDEIGVALEPFRQLDSANKAGGTGLGLPVTKALVEANRASFAIQSRKNEGTLIEVAFPPAPAGLAAE